jgi:hypothetical protein
MSNLQNGVSFMRAWHLVVMRVLFGAMSLVVAGGVSALFARILVQRGESSSVTAALALAAAAAGFVGSMVRWVWLDALSRRGDATAPDGSKTPDVLLIWGICICITVAALAVRLVPGAIEWVSLVTSATIAGLGVGFAVVGTPTRESTGG